MASSKIVAVPVVFTLALLLVAYCAEATICSRKNPSYPGSCRSNKDCANSCTQHGLGTSGYCKGNVRFFKTCFCTFECPGGGGGGGGGGNPPGVKPLSNGH
ncbi:unnamed protein product [Miscanthus lutarioriparius]|uniref:Knottins-like domain-containing protein n=1 Tax=Miscanthus lutarioriparius TaxID=422564 RepID=A0A811NQQ3_9POAL|nr:unnamed protein product [Miscanthus lutarioriparius]